MHAKDKSWERTYLKQTDSSSSNCTTFGFRARHGVALPDLRRTANERSLGHERSRVESNNCEGTQSPAAATALSSSEEAREDRPCSQPYIVSPAVAMPLRRTSSSSCCRRVALRQSSSAQRICSIAPRFARFALPHEPSSAPEPCRNRTHGARIPPDTKNLPRLPAPAAQLSSAQPRSIPDPSDRSIRRLQLANLFQNDDQQSARRRQMRIVGCGIERSSNRLIDRSSERARE